MSAPTPVALSAKRYLHSLGPLPEPMLRCAHDVRHLVCCVRCRQVADARHTVLHDGRHFHGRCFVARFGLPALKALGPAAWAGLTLGDIGAAAFRHLLGTGTQNSRRQTARSCGRSDRREKHKRIKR